MTGSPAAEPDAPEWIEPRVRQIVSRCTDVSDGSGELPADASLWAAGMDSLSIVRIVVTIEEELDLEFPPDLLVRDTFNSIGSITSAISSLMDGRAEPAEAGQ